MKEGGEGRRWREEEVGEDGGRKRMEEAEKRRTGSDRWREGEGRVYCKKRQMSKMAGRRRGWVGGGGGRGRGRRGEGGVCEEKRGACGRKTITEEEKEGR